MYSIHSCPDGQSLADHVRNKGIVLTPREHRSALSQDAHVTFTVLIGLFLSMAILPSLRGELLVPLISLGTMALLIGALECRWQRIEIALCLSVEERRAVAALLAREVGEASA